MKKTKKQQEDEAIALAIEISRRDQEEKEKKDSEDKKAEEAAVVESKLVYEQQTEKRARYEKSKRIFVVHGDPPLNFEAKYVPIQGDGLCGWRASPIFQNNTTTIEDVKSRVAAWLTVNEVPWVESPRKVTKADQYHMVVFGLIESKQVLCFQPGHHPSDTVEEDGNFINLTKKFKKVFYSNANATFPWEHVFDKTDYLVYEFSNFALDFSQPRDHWSTFTFNGNYYLHTPRRIDSWEVRLDGKPKHIYRETYKKKDSQERQTDI